jgi:predicted anti-sigma-YlaC factor YlaD
MDCDFIKNKLFAIAENRLPEAELEEAREHLAKCASCAGAVSSFTSFMEVIEQERKTETDPFLAAKTLHSMESYRPAKGPGLFIRMPGSLQPVFATTLIILALLTGFIAGKQGKNIGRNPVSINSLNTMKSELFISELRDEDKILKLYK